MSILLRLVIGADVVEFLDPPGQGAGGAGIDAVGLDAAQRFGEVGMKRRRDAHGEPAPFEA